jgi:hypothetical protein
MQGGTGAGLTTRIAAIIAFFALATGPLPAQAQLSNGKGDLRVMTYNVDEGTDFNEVVAAQTLTEFLLAVGATITQVRATDPPSRMQAVAQQIIAGADACQPPGTRSVVHRAIPSDDADVWSSNDRVRYGAGADERAGSPGCCLHDRL